MRSEVEPPPLSPSGYGCAEGRMSQVKTTTGAPPDRRGTMSLQQPLGAGEGGRHTCQLLRITRKCSGFSFILQSYGRTVNILRVSQVLLGFIFVIAIRHRSTRHPF